ncbi:zinc finger protein 271-like [Neodiprion virginianus]|uniref:zinc finger protein 271-like n=1 Tax=Neodiprion virginianus TaxID=2961670 RepID=UPI001EE74326|nr:zinc finger protein 271-like [Neodiprion virginianus]XP_046606593.1 zinc finger protein 271-like [Neodiprion virginianus]XP_046606594.1 zinc finger protein 271-like [Neodiprion virginianus]XP_046606595.1 zinc finger protein 271-like [Neodiprion virginianus]XP_046606596.1 zinc finger protein 271-like [Neodiprion virginianus]
MMGRSKCPNCGENTNASSSRLIEDACGHRKCRICLVDEEDGCKTCQNTPHIQKIGNFDYPVRSSQLESMPLVSSVSKPRSEKEETPSQPLELVMNKMPDHDRVQFDEQDSCESESSGRQSEWVDHQNISAENIPGILNSNHNNTAALAQRYVTSETGFNASEQVTELQAPVILQAHAQKIEPLELVTDVRFSPKTENNHQNMPSQIRNRNEKNDKTIDIPEREESKKVKGRKNSKLKRSHISIIPGPQETYRCNICGKTFKSATAQRYHDSCLTGIKPYKCTICDRSFVKQSHFQYHERTHTGYKPFKCSFCGKAFPQRNKLNRHLHCHQDEKRYKCSICEKRYSSQNDLKSHMNVHTGVMPYTCQICKKSFREATNLTRHMHTHSNERPHMCEQCGKSFKDKSLLVRHRRTHGKERPFSCSECSKVFLSKSELSRHLAVHSDDKPFPCQFCSTVFRRKDNLNRHMRHHHLEDQTSMSENKTKNGEDETRPVKLKPAITSKPKTKPKGKPRAISAVLPNSPCKMSLHYLNSHTQIDSQLDCRSNVTPVIRTTSELSNAVPVINGPISIKRPEEKMNSPKKAFTHTEPIPLAEAVVINRRIEEKLYPKTNLNHDCYFQSDFCNRIDRHSVHKIIPLRPNTSNKPMTVGKIQSPERSQFEGQSKKTQPSLPEKLLFSENQITQLETVKTLTECHDIKGMNIPRHTVPKKRAIDQLKSKPITDYSSNFLTVFLPETLSSTTKCEPERANCVPTITKARCANSRNDLRESNLSTACGPDNFASNEINVIHIEGVEKSSNVKKLSDIHWRRRTSEILRPRIHGFNSYINCQLSKLEMPNELTDVKMVGARK